jgi:hypothetical protein
VTILPALGPRSDAGGGAGPHVTAWAKGGARDAGAPRPATRTRALRSTRIERVSPGCGPLGWEEAIDQTAPALEPDYEIEQRVIG